MSFWAAVPHYLPQPPCPKATLALLGQVEDLLETAIPLGDLPEESRAWERGVAELAEEDEDVAEYVRNLEESQDTAELPEASGEAIAREFERYLKRRDAPDDARTTSVTAPLELRRTEGRQCDAERASTSCGCLAGAGLGVVAEVGGVGPVVEQRAGRSGRRGRRPGRRARRSTTCGGRGAGARGDGRRATCRAGRLRPRDVGLVPLPVAAVVVAEQHAAGSPSGRGPLSRSFETSTRLPLDFDIFSPSSPTIPACT